MGGMLLLIIWGAAHTLRELTGSCMLQLHAALLMLLSLVPSLHLEDIVWLVGLQWDVQISIFWWDSIMSSTCVPTFCIF